MIGVFSRFSVKWLGQEGNSWKIYYIESDNGCQDWDNAHSKKTLRWKKKLTIAANLKVDTVRHLIHSNCRPDQGLNNAKITENENDRPIPC